MGKLLRPCMFDDTMIPIFSTGHKKIGFTILREILMKSTVDIRNTGNTIISESTRILITSLASYVVGKIMNGSAPIIETYMFKYTTAD